MALKLALCVLSVLELFAITDGNIRSDPVIIASILNCDPVGTWMRHRHRCICRPHFHGLRCERIYRCVSGKPRNVSCTYPETEHMAAVKARCLHGHDEIEVCECFDGYCGPLCEQKIQPQPLSLVFSPQQEAPMRFKPYMEEDSYEEAYHDEEWSFWSPDNSHWIAFVLLHLVLVCIALTAVSVAIICYLRRKKSIYRTIDEFAKPPGTPVVEDCEKPSSPPKYDDIVHEVRVDENVQERKEENLGDTALVVNTSVKRPYLHV